MSRRPRKHLTRLVPTLTDSMPWHVWNRFPGSLSRHPMTQRDGSSDPVQPFGSKTQADSNVRFLHNLSDIIVYKLSCSWNMCAIVYIYVQYKYMYVLPGITICITFLHGTNHHHSVTPSNHQSDSSNVGTNHPFTPLLAPWLLHPRVVAAFLGKNMCRCAFSYEWALSWLTHSFKAKCESIKRYYRIQYTHRSS